MDWNCLWFIFCPFLTCQIFMFSVLLRSVFDVCHAFGFFLMCMNGFWILRRCNKGYEKEERKERIQLPLNHNVSTGKTFDSVS